MRTKEEVSETEKKEVINSYKQKVKDTGTKLAASVVKVLVALISTAGMGFGIRAGWQAYGSLAGWLNPMITLGRSIVPI